MKDCYLIFNRCDNHMMLMRPFFCYCFTIICYRWDVLFRWSWFNFLRKGKIAYPFEPARICLCIIRKNRQWKFGWFNFFYRHLYSTFSLSRLFFIFSHSRFKSFLKVILLKRSYRFRWGQFRSFFAEQFLVDFCVGVRLWGPWLFSLRNSNFDEKMKTEISDTQSLQNYEKPAVLRRHDISNSVLVSAVYVCFYDFWSWKIVFCSKLLWHICINLKENS